MTLFSARTLLITGLSFFSFFISNAQDESPEDIWAIPWVSVGDSSTEKSDQKVIVTGKVTVKGSSEFLVGASISVDLAKYFDYSDTQGKYLLQIPPGKYRIIIRNTGMKPLYVKLRVYSGGVFNFQMEEGATRLDEVSISSRPIDSNVKESISGLAKLNVQEVKTLPTLMGEVDIIKSLQLMPGVSSVGEGSSGFNVRGGRTDQNLVLFNGVPVFNTSHALGFVSAFNQDIIKNFGLYKGNVPANFGGRASSVLEINSRGGDFEKWKYQGGVGPISSRFAAEGPIIKSKTSLLVAGRFSYADWFLKKVSDPNLKKSSISFYDAFASLSHRITSNSTADVTFYSSQDYFRFSQQFGYQWNSYLINARWQGFTDRKASPSFSISYGHYKNTLIDPSGIDASTLSNTLNYLHAKQIVNYNPVESHAISAGFEGLMYLPKPEEQLAYNGNPAIVNKQVDKNNGIEYAVFVNDDFEINESISISAGVRLSGYSHIGADTVYHYSASLPKSTGSITDTTYYKEFESIKSFGGFEPRISMRFNITPNQSIKFGYNRMRQYIHMISNTTAPTPVDLWQVSNEYLPPQIADNFSLGYFLNIKNNEWETYVDFFFKSMQNLVEYKNFPSLYLNQHLETELLSGIGRAYGGEFYIRRLKGKWTGWASYTYSQSQVKVSSQFMSETINGGSWYPSNYNKPHIFNLVINRKLNKNGAISLVFSYATGRPLTAIESSYIVGGAVVPIYSDRNKYKIPNYIRVDFSFTIGDIIRKLDDSLVFSVYNLFGRDNAYSVFYQRPANNYFIPKAYKLSVLGSPLPSLTYNFKF